MSGRDTLRSHQIVGAEWLSKNPRAYLADAPRVGKTRTALGALIKIGEPVTLVICPAIVQSHWRREADEMGIGRIYVASYDAVMRGGNALMKDFLIGKGVTAMIVDEAHYLGNRDSKRTNQVLGIDGYARRMDTVWALSGTPIPKRPTQLWPILAALFPARMLDAGIKTMKDFSLRFEVTTQRFARGAMRDKVVGVKNADELRALIGPAMLRRTLSDLGGDVPELDWQVLRVDADTEEITDDATWRNVVAALEDGSLERIASDPHVARMRRRIGEVKCLGVADLVVEELRDDPTKKVVVFAHHRSVLDALELAFVAAKIGIAYIDGGTTPSKRDEEIEAFQNDPNVRIFLGQNIACQTGIRLDAADTAILVEPDWTAVVNEQLGNRVIDTQRPGRKCVVQMVALANTIDEGIVSQNRREVRMVSEILG